MQKGLRSVLTHEVLFRDIMGYPRKWVKGTVIDIYIMPKTSTYFDTDGVVMSNLTKDIYIGIKGLESTQIHRFEFKAID